MDSGNRVIGKTSVHGLAWAVAAGVLLSSTTVWSQGMKLKADLRLDLQANGNASATYTMRFPAQVYQGVKSRGNANDSLKLMSRGEMELHDGVAGYRDADSSLVMTATMLGAAKALGAGRWEIEVEECR